MWRRLSCLRWFALWLLVVGALVPASTSRVDPPVIGATPGALERDTRTAAVKPRHQVRTAVPQLARATTAVQEPARASTVELAQASAPTRASRLPTRDSRLLTDLGHYATSRSTTFSVGVYDESTHRGYWFRPTRGYDNASIIKVNILETVLWRAQRAHRWLTTWEQRQSEQMIRHSNNSAASALWADAGYSSGVAAYDRALKLTGTTFSSGGAWGLTRSTVKDQILLLRAVGTGGSSPLSARSRAYVRTQMAHVQADQRWGVSAGVPGGSTVQLKNGWLPRATHGWRVNSIGRIRSGSRDYEIAFLSTDNASMSYGVATAQAVSRIVYRDLGGS